MPLYVAESFSWMKVIEADTAREALTIAKRTADQASLLPSDIQYVRRATEDDVAWFKAMGGKF